MSARPLAELVDAGWADALAPVEHVVHGLGERLRAEVEAGRPYLPPGDAVLRAFRRPMADARVLVVGQDPYPTPGHSIGLAFAVERHVRPLPRSLGNIYRELRDDLDIAPAAHGDLTNWADQGVLLLNRVLTVEAGVTASHRGWGWEQVTEAAIRALVARRGTDGAPLPLVAILWGAHAQQLAPLLDGVPVIASPHPSPLSARRGFFGSRPFSRANAALEAQGASPIDWRIPDAP
jgi:uracil-DNA glycosylase